MFFIHLKTK